MMTSDDRSCPLANVADDIILTNYGHIYSDFLRACHVTLYTDFVRGYATFHTLLKVADTGIIIKIYS